MAWASAAIWRRGEQEVSLARLYVLRAVALFFAVDGLFSKLPGLIHPDSASRGIIASLLAALWLSAFLAVRYPLRMMPIFLFELVWKSFWLIDYGLPQWLGGTGSPRLGRDMFEIGFFPFVIALIIPWHYVWRHYVRQPAERWRDRHPGPGSQNASSARAAKAGGSEVSRFRLYLLRANYLVWAIAGCFLILPAIVQPDQAMRGMQESMLAGLWLCAIIGVRHPLRMVPMLLFDFIWKTVWLIDHGLPRLLSGTDAPHLRTDLLWIGNGPILLGLVIPWLHVWRHYVLQPGERWR